MPICAHLFWSRTRSAGQKASQDSACADTLFCCSAGGRRARSASDGLRGQITKRRAQEHFFRQRRGAKRRTSVRTLRGQGCRIRRGRPRRSKGATCRKNMRRSIHVFFTRRSPASSRAALRRPPRERENSYYVYRPPALSYGRRRMVSSLRLGGAGPVWEPPWPWRGMGGGREGNEGRMEGTSGRGGKEGY